MGRAGGGGGHAGGGHSAGGGFSGGGRSGGGHPGGNPGGRPGGPGGPGGRPGGPGAPPPRPGFWGGFGYGGYGGYRRGCGTGCLTPIIIVIVFIVIIISSAVSSLGGGVRYALSRLRGNTQQVEDTTDYNNYDREDEDSAEDAQSISTREKADTGVTFTSDCILDELGWVEDKNAVGESLESFYNATGVQPYVYFKAYDASLTTESEKEEYAYDWYDENIDNEGTFLFIYFAEEDSDNDVGYMVYVNGYDIDSVMDEEAVEIFWDYVDEYWYSSLSTDDMLTEIFNSTANAIMN